MSGMSFLRYTVYGYNHRKLKKQKQNTKMDVWIIMQTDTERERKK